MRPTVSGVGLAGAAAELGMSHRGAERALRPAYSELHFLIDDAHRSVSLRARLAAVDAEATAAGADDPDAFLIERYPAVPTKPLQLARHLVALSTRPVHAQ
jgi:hypothetical protein